MIKIVLIILIIIFTSLIGYFIKFHYINNLNFYIDCKNFIENYINEISFQKSRYQDIVSKMKFSEAFTKFILHDICPYYISNGDKIELISFKESIGKFDIDGEISNSKNYLLKFNNKIQKGKEDIKCRGELYFKLSIVIGLIIAIILI